MSVAKWNERYRAGEQLFTAPTPLVVEFAERLPKGAALDLACGPGRNALYLAQLGWRVTAVDGSPIAIDILRIRADERRLHIDTSVADLERGEFEIPANAYDLICDCYYLQRDLISKMQAGVRPGGLIVSIVHLDEKATETRATPGELREHFAGWEILHYYEGMPAESCHQRAVAQLVARKG